MRCNGFLGQSCQIKVILLHGLIFSISTRSPYCNAVLRVLSYAWWSELTLRLIQWLFHCFNFDRLYLLFTRGVSMWLRYLLLLWHFYEFQIFKIFFAIFSILIWLNIHSICIRLNLTTSALECRLIDFGLRPLWQQIETFSIDIVGEFVIVPW